MALTKEHILTALNAWIRQRPGLEFGNYGDMSSYRSELRSITKDRHVAERLLTAVALRDSITAEALLKAFSAYSGRLTIGEVTRKDGSKGAKLDYCTGQYWPTEYRRAACAVLASALWTHVREHCMPEPTQDGEFTLYKGVSAGDYLRNYFRREFGRSIQSRFFD